MQLCAGFPIDVQIHLCFFEQHKAKEISATTLNIDRCFLRQWRCYDVLRIIFWDDNGNGRCVIIQIAGDNEKPDKNCNQRGGDFNFVSIPKTLFLKEFFGENTKSRFRPHFFPFTEPSVEVDIEWGDKGWLEILGSGMIDPEVFKSVEYDAEKYSGFAFGMGLDRIAMLKYGIPNIKLLYENDVRFLSQF